MALKKQIPESEKENHLIQTLEAGQSGEIGRYPLLLVGEVWEKGKKEFGFFFFKRDHFGKIIAKHEYCKKTQYGWNIVHIIPKDQGGSDEIDNLIPVHWENAIHAERTNKEGA